MIIKLDAITEGKNFTTIPTSVPAYMVEMQNNIENKLDILESYIEMMEDDDILEEGLIENISDTIHNIITYITKGRSAMIAEVEKTASEASDYYEEIKRIADDKRKIWRYPILIETYTVTYTDGQTRYTEVTIRNPKFCGVIFNFKDLLNKTSNMDNKQLRKWKAKLRNDCVEDTKFTPKIDKKTDKMTPAEAMKIVSTAITNGKADAKVFRERTDKMFKNIEEGKAMLDSLKNNPNSESAKNTIKTFKTILGCQKSYYAHDMRLMHVNNIAIIRQSRYIRDKLKNINVNA